MTVRKLIHELLDKGELDTRVVIETANGDYNITKVESFYVQDNEIILCIDEWGWYAQIVYNISLS